jgi:hypothetical protein
VARDAECGAKLAKRTVTNLYNERPAWLDMAHRRLDEAVFDAYGWPADLSREQILERLLALNLGRQRRTASGWKRHCGANSLLRRQKSGCAPVKTVVRYSIFTTTRIAPNPHRRGSGSMGSLLFLPFASPVGSPTFPVARSDDGDNDRLHRINQMLIAGDQTGTLIPYGEFKKGAIQHG